MNVNVQLLALQTTRPGKGILGTKVFSFFWFIGGVVVVLCFWTDLIVIRDPLSDLVSKLESLGFGSWKDGGGTLPRETHLLSSYLKWWETNLHWNEMHRKKTRWRSLVKEKVNRTHGDNSYLARIKFSIPTRS